MDSLTVRLGGRKMFQGTHPHTEGKHRLPFGRDPFQDELMAWQTE